MNPPQSVVLECAKKNILIAKYGDNGMTRKGHLAVDVERGQVVGDYPWAGLDKDADHGHSDSYECVYEAKFDEAPGEDKFLIFSQNLTNFQVWSLWVKNPILFVYARVNCYAWYFIQS